MIHAAGIVYQDRKGRALFIRRSGVSDHAGEWSFPGGQIEDGESPLEAALREAAEELGKPPVATPPIRLLVTEDDNVRYTTYHARVSDAFVPELNEEHTAWTWTRPDEAPEPLHPGAAAVVRRLGMNELDLARAIASGELQSPQRHENVWLFAIRITGTGVAYRPSLKEFVWRDSELYLNRDFLERCNGLPVIWQHPKHSVLNSKEYADRVIGSIMLPYVKGSEVWGIAKIYDETAAKAMDEHQLSTSPAVVFRDPLTNDKVRLEDGRTLLIEGEPSLLDHVAICDVGVWDKAGAPTGVLNETLADERADSMTEKVEGAAAETAKADASDAGILLDKLLTKLDAISSRMDAWEEREKSRSDAAKRSDEFPPKKDEEGGEKAASKADESGEEKKEGEKKEGAKADAEPGKVEDKSKDLIEKEKRSAGETKEVAADKRKDSEGEHAEKPGEELKMDSAVIRDLRAQLERQARQLAEMQVMTRPIPEADLAAFADAQARADSAYQAFGKRAPSRLAGETLNRYRARLAREMQKYSAKWKGTDLAKALDSGAFDAIEADIYADSIAASSRAEDLGYGQLREIIKTDPTTGRREVTFVGPNTYIAQFKAPARRVAGFSTKG